MTLIIPEQGFTVADELRPRSTETEAALIGAILRGGRGVYERVNDIVLPEMFYSQSHQSVWKAVGKLFEQGLQIDTIVVGDEMERMQALGELEAEWGNGVWTGRAYLSDLRSSGDPRHAETYAEQVQDYHFKRHLLEFSGKMAGWAANGRRAKDIIQDVETEFSKLQIHGTQDEHTVPVSVGVSEAYDWTSRAANGEIVGVPTGLIDIDAILGSLINGNLYYLAGRPGQGKTGLLLTIARNVAKLGKRVGIFSLEMSLMQVSQRLIAQEAEIDLDRLMQGKLQDHEWPKYTQGVETVSNWPIVINDLSSINMPQIRQTSRKIKAASGLDLLIVDYVQLAGSDGKKYERRDLEVSAISKGLKYLADELGVPVLAAAQMSRAVEQRQGKRPVLSDLRESGSLEQDGYAVMFLYPHEDESRINVKVLDVQKHRNGKVDRAELLFRGPFTRFDNLTSRSYTPSY